MNHYEREVLGQTDSRSRAASRPRGGSFLLLFAALAVGVIPIVACSQAPIFTLEKLQWVLAVFGVVMAGTEASQSGRWLFAVGAIVLVISVYFRGEISLALMMLCAWDFTQYRPSIGSTSLLWFSLAILGGMFL